MYGIFQGVVTIINILPVILKIFQAKSNLIFDVI